MFRETVDFDDVRIDRAFDLLHDRPELAPERIHLGREVEEGDPLHYGSSTRGYIVSQVPCCGTTNFSRGSVLRATSQTRVSGA